MLRSVARPAYHKLLRMLPSEAALQVQFLISHGRMGSFREPLTFSEKIQWRKLFDSDIRFVDWSDKVCIKSIVTEILGARWVIPTLWDGPVLPPIEDRNWDIPFVIKPNHASGWNYFVRSADDLNWPLIERATERWMRTDWDAHLHEAYYNRIKRRILIEPIIGDLSLLDYKFFCFSGRVEYIQVDTGRFTDHRRCFYDSHWKKMEFTYNRYPIESKSIPRPFHLDEMIYAAERLSSDFDFVRLDLYDLPDHPVFGEATFLPGSGFAAFSDYDVDREFGKLWRLRPWFCSPAYPR
jgi:hypothetical protein